MIKGYLAAAMLVGLVGAALAPTVSMAEEGAKATAVRSEVGKPIQAALDLIKAKKTKEALAKVRDAEAVKDRTPYEIYLTERVKAQAYAGAGDAMAAARAFESAAALPGAPAAERTTLLSAAAGQYYSGRDYAKAAAISGRYLKDGGTDATMRTIYVQSLYLSGDYAATAKALSAELQGQKKPSEEQLQMLAQAYLKLNDQAAYGKTVERLLSNYPKKEYWQSVIYAVKQQPGMSDRLALDLSRLLRATGTLRTSAEYEDAVALALQQGYPIEAKKAYDEGMAAKIMGQGTDADRHRRLGDMTNKQLAEDKQTLGTQDAQAVARLAKQVGARDALHGQADKGLEMMEAGIKKGGLKRAEDAKLRLGYAYYVAGKRAKAIQVMKSVTGTDGAATLAGLWGIYLAQSN